MFQSVRKTLRGVALSQEAMNICLASNASSTSSSYQHHLHEFKDFCTRHNVTDHLSTTAATGVEFLTQLFHQGKSYSTINSARSALSQFVELSDSPNDFGTHPLTRTFMKGVFKLRPPQPRYQSTWDVKPVLDWAKTLTNSELNLKLLSIKCVMLIALASGQRMQTIAALDLGHTFVHSDKVVFNIAKIIKTSKPGVHHAIELCRFPEDLRICPVECLEKYLEATKSIRKDTNLFISFHKPHNTVSAQTLSRWIRNALELSGVDRVFKPHSTRGAAASKAASNIDISVVLKTVGWRSHMTFARFYNRPIQTDSNLFSTSVLGSS